jgi:hypothetical protein
MRFKITLQSDDGMCAHLFLGSIVIDYFFYNIIVLFLADLFGGLDAFTDFPR